MPAEIAEDVVGVGTKQFAEVIVPPFVVVNVTEYILGPQTS